MGPLSISFLLLVLPLLLVVDFIIRRRTGLPSLAFLRLLHQIHASGNRFLHWSTDLLLSSSTHTIVLPYGVLSSDPAVLDHVFKSNFANYPKGTDSGFLCHDLLGHGIINSDGEAWRLQRQAALLQLHSREFKALVGRVVQEQANDQLVPYLSRRQGTTVDLQEVFERFTFDVSCRLAIGVDPGTLAGESGGNARVLHAFEEATLVTVQRTRNPLWKVQRLLGVGAERGMRAAVVVMHEFIDSTIRSRKEELASSPAAASKRDDLLSRIIASGGYSDESLRDAAINFVAAGRDTVSTAMTWLFWEVASHSAVEQTILDELRSIRGKRSGGEGSDGCRAAPFTAEDVRRMDYLHSVVAETLRFYPPLSMTVRTCSTADVLPDGTKVPAGRAVISSAFAMGRMRSLWGEDCLEFRPERWLTGAGGEFKPASQTKYPVFHVGQRTCLGKDIAYAQAKAVAAAVLERFKVEVVAEGGGGEAEVVALLRMVGGLPVRLTEREAVS